MAHRRWTTRVWITGALLLAGCATGDAYLAKDGLPIWVDKPCAGLPKEALCAVGESDFAAVDVEAAKTDAETAAKNKLADQLESKIGRLTERLSSAMKDLTTGKYVGERTLKEINQNFQQATLRGLRFEEYHFHPNRLEPKRVWVRAILTVETNQMSQEIMNAMMTDALAQKLELKHEEAQARFDAVRRQYLAEEERAAEADR